MYESSENIMLKCWQQRKKKEFKITGQLIEFHEDNLSSNKLLRILNYATSYL